MAASEQELRRALLEAHRAGDKRAAELFARDLRAMAGDQARAFGGAQIEGVARPEAQIQAPLTGSTRSKISRPRRFALDRGIDVDEAVAQELFAPGKRVELTGPTDLSRIREGMQREPTAMESLSRGLLRTTQSLAELGSGIIRGGAKAGEALEQGPPGTLTQLTGTALKAIFGNDWLKRTVGEGRATEELQKAIERIPVHSTLKDAVARADQAESMLGGMAGFGRAFADSDDKIGFLNSQFLEQAPVILGTVIGAKGAGSVIKGAGKAASAGRVAAGAAGSSVMATYGPNVAAGLANGIEYDDAQARALKRSFVQGLVDGTTAAFVPFKIGPNQFVNVPAQAVLQMAGGAGGEYLAARSVGEEVGYGELAAEALLELLGLPGDVAAAFTPEARQKIGKAIVDTTRRPAADRAPVESAIPGEPQGYGIPQLPAPERRAIADTKRLPARPGAESITVDSAGQARQGLPPEISNQPVGGRGLTESAGPGPVAGDRGPDVGRIAQEREGLIELPGGFKTDALPIDTEALDAGNRRQEELALERKQAADMGLKEIAAARRKLLVGRGKEARPKASEDHFIAFLAKSGGLSRELFEAEGVDPAMFKAKRGSLQGLKFLGTPLFPQTGGMSLADVAELLAENGFFPGQDASTVDDNAALYLVMDALQQYAQDEQPIFIGPAQWKAGELDLLDRHEARVRAESEAPPSRPRLLEEGLAEDQEVPTPPESSAGERELGWLEEAMAAAPTEVSRAPLASPITPEAIRDLDESSVRQVAQDLAAAQFKARVAGREVPGVNNMAGLVVRADSGELDGQAFGFLDLDNFKAPNDRFGHQVGDELLLRFGARLAEKIGALGGQVYHRGGDEFIPVAPDEQALAATLEELREEVQGWTFDTHEGPQDFPAFSFGLGFDQGTAEQAQKLDKEGRFRRGLRQERRAIERRRSDGDEGQTGDQGGGELEAGASGAPARQTERAGESEAASGAQQAGEDAGLDADLLGAPAALKDEADQRAAAAEVKEKAERNADERRRKKLAKADDGGLFDSQRQLLDLTRQDESNQGAAPAADTTERVTVAEWRGLRDRLRKGETVRAAEWKESFRRLVGSEQSLKDLLNSRAYTIKRLKREFPAGFRPTGTKAELVDAIYDNMVQQFALSQTIAFNPFEKGGRRGAVTRAVEKVTDEDIEQYQAERKADGEKLLGALNEPKTLEDFKTFINYRGKDKLNDAQRVRYDELRGESKLKRLVREKKERDTVEPIGGAGVEFRIKETRHTQKGHDLFVVQAVTKDKGSRVDRDTFLRIKAEAQKLGGYYSRFAKDGAIPGFQFRSRDSAEQFVAALTGEISGDQAVEGKTAGAQEKAAARLHQMAQDLRSRAEASLAQDRREGTARQSRMAQAASNAALGNINFANLLDRIAKAIEAGEAKFLAGLRQKVQLETLEQMLRAGRLNRVRADEISYSEEQKLGPYGEADIKHAQFPDFSGTLVDQVRRLAAALQRTPGLKLLGNRVAKLVKGRDPNHRVDVPAELALEVVRKAKKSSRVEDHDLGWYWPEQAARRRRLEGMGITDSATLRSALRELQGLRGAQKKADPLKELERELKQEGGGIGADFFPTPPAVVERMMAAADIGKGAEVLEPSAGMGDLVQAALDAGAKVDAVEISGRLNTFLHERFKGLEGVTIYRGDFMAEDAFEDGQPEYDRVLMNPPFSKGQDVAHVRRAFELLRPGGRLVSIMAEHAFFASDKTSQAFREFVLEHGQSERLPAGSFKSSFNPTGVATRLVVLNKPQSASEALKSKDRGEPAPELDLVAARRQLDDAFGADAVDALLKSGKVRFAPSIEAADKDGSLRAALGPGKHAGGYLPNIDASFIFLDAVGDHLPGVVLHEVGWHQGLRRILGDREFARLKEDIQKRIDAGDPVFVKARGKVPADTHPDAVLEETAAYALDDNAALKLNFFQRLLARLRAWLRKRFKVRPKVSVQDLVWLARGGLRAVANGKPLSGITLSERVVVRGKGGTAVIEQQADVALRHADKRIDSLKRLRGCLK